MMRTGRKKAVSAVGQLPLIMEAPTSAPVLAPTLTPPEPAGDPPIVVPRPGTIVPRLPTLTGFDPRHAPQQPAFGAWLIKQKERGGFVGDLAKAAAGDRGFPRNGDVAAVLKHLATVGADGDMFEALEDAERAWLGS